MGNGPGRPVTSLGYVRRVHPTGRGARALRYPEGFGPVHEWAAAGREPAGRLQPAQGPGYRTRDDAAAELLARWNRAHPDERRDPGQAPGRVGRRGVAGQTTIRGTIPEAPTPARELLERGRRLRRERLAAGLTLRDLEAITGVDVPKLSRLERGLIDDPAAWSQVATFGLEPRPPAERPGEFVVEAGPHDAGRSAFEVPAPGEVSRGGRMWICDTLEAARGKALEAAERLGEPLTSRRTSQFLYLHDGERAVYMYQRTDDGQGDA